LRSDRPGTQLVIYLVIIGIMVLVAVVVRSARPRERPMCP
jgi:hypothetical protein